MVARCRWFRSGVGSRQKTRAEHYKEKTQRNTAKNRKLHGNAPFYFVCRSIREFKRGIAARLRDVRRDRTMPVTGDSPLSHPNRGTSRLKLTWPFPALEVLF